MATIHGRIVLSILYCAVVLLGTFLRSAAHLAVVDDRRYNTSVAYVEPETVAADISFQIVVVGSRTGNVFVAGRNWLYQFDGSLKLLRRVRTGGRRHGSPEVEADPRCTGCEVDNDAKVLMLFPHLRRRAGPDGLLLFCGTSGVNGSCSGYSSADLSLLGTFDPDRNLTRSAATWSSSENIVPFVGTISGSDVDADVDEVAVYAALSSGRPVGSVSNLLLRVSDADPAQSRPNTPIEMVYRFGSDAGDVSSVNVKTQPFWRNFVLHYVYGFEHANFSYFLTVQRQLPGIPSSVLVTRLVRFCQHDEAMNSYVEITLTCSRRQRLHRSATGASTDTVARTAWLLSSGDGDDADRPPTLYVVFDGDRMPPVTGSPDGAARRVGAKMCAYDMGDVVKSFVSAQKDCYTGYGQQLEWISRSSPRCQRDLKLASLMNEQFCGNPLNGGGIGGRYDLMSDACWSNEAVNATSLWISVQSNRVIAVIGTSDGQVLKVPADGSYSAVFASIDVEDADSWNVTSQVRIADMSADKSGQYIYVLTNRRVTRLPIRSCSLYTDCVSCVTSHDALGCGWCDGRCANSTECKTLMQPQYFDNCPPVIHSFFPHSGPTSGGTLITVHGHNFGNGTINTEDGSNASATVRLGPTDCLIYFRNSTTIICQTAAVSSRLNQDLKVYVSDLSKTTINVGILGSATSDHQSFAYKEPVVTSFSPMAGPKLGGTLVTFVGKDLNIGSNLSVTVSDQPCPIISLSSVSVVCRTSEYTKELSTVGQNVSMNFTIDAAQLIPVNDCFTYTDNPSVIAAGPITTFLSGSLVIPGSNLHVVQKPEIIYHMNESNSTQSCSAQFDGSFMTCLLPNLSMYSSPPFALDAHFQFDEMNLNLSVVHLTVVADPIITSKNATCIPSTDDWYQLLHIQGRNLNLSAKMSDYIVKVGSQECNVTKLTMTELFCQLPLDSVTMASEVKIMVGQLTFTSRQIFCVYHLKYHRQSLTVAAVVMGFLSTLSVGVTIICLVCLRNTRRWPFRKRCQMEPNVLYTATQFMPLEPSSPVEQTCSLNSYWTRSLMARERLLRTQNSCEPLLDEETRRLLDDSHLLIPRDRLLLLDVIGQGHFGCVFRGFLKLPGQKTEHEVAVKTLKSFTECVYTSEIEMRKFLDEALTMREFSDSNVLQLIGIVMDRDQMPLVILPFMKHGDLLSYIRDETNSPSVKDLMEFGIQIADGMTYLSGLKFVHRDLAARNCMLDDNMVVKVADFGLSRDIYERDYYSSDDRKAKLPVKWMALESLEKGIYNIRTDVWSYGVVLWELMTRGVCPYPEVDNWDIVKYLKTGRRMLQPSYCPDPLFSLMMRCWDVDPGRRPLFPELSATVLHIIVTMQAVAARRVKFNANYINNSLSPTVSDYLKPQEDVNDLFVQQCDKELSDLACAKLSDEQFQSKGCCLLVDEQAVTCPHRPTGRDVPSDSDCCQVNELDLSDECSQETTTRTGQTENNSAKHITTV